MSDNQRLGPTQLFGVRTQPPGDAAASQVMPPQHRSHNAERALPDWARTSDREGQWAEFEAVTHRDVGFWGEPDLDGSAPPDGDGQDAPRVHERVLLAVGGSPWRLVAAAAVVVLLGAVVQLQFGADTDSGPTAAVGLGSDRPENSGRAGADGEQPGADTLRSGPGIAADPGLDVDAAPADGEGQAGGSGADSVESDVALPSLPVASGSAGDTGGGDGTGTSDGDGQGGDAPASADQAGTVGSDAAGNPSNSNAPAPASANRPAVGTDYESNLALIRNQTVRNRNEDDSPHRNTPSADLVPENHYGPRSEYLAKADGNVEPSFPVENGGQFRVACEFSHFAYDDPLVYPGRPGASHLHMFFGNTDANAYSTADSIKNSGGSTCNGNELNRTAYWVPAMFDAQGKVRIPERVVIYYKGEGLARGNAEVFPPGAAMITSVDLNTVNPAEGGAAGKFSYNCANNYSGLDSKLSNTMPVCDGDTYFNQYGVDDPYEVLEVNVKFPQCWNGRDPGNPANFRHPTYAGWYGSVCDGEFNRTLVNLEYFVNYRVERGETTQGWYLSSDVSPTERQLAQTPGSTNHGDWWGRLARRDEPDVHRQLRELQESVRYAERLWLRLSHRWRSRQREPQAGACVEAA